MTTANIRILKEDGVHLLRRRCLSGIPFLIAIGGFCCSYSSNFGCTNVQFVPNTESLPDDFFRPRSISFGLWMYQSQRMTTVQDGEIVYTEFCSGYDPHSIYIDSMWRVAKIVSVIGIILSGFLLLWQFVAPFLLFDTNYWRIATILYIILAALQGLTLLFLQSSACTDNALLYMLAYTANIYPTTCSWDRGTRISIASVILYGVTALSMIIIPAPGARPKERPYPMMVWDTTTISNGDDNIAKTTDDDDDDDDGESVSSFAHDNDDDDEHATSKKYNHREKRSSWKEQQDVTDTSYSNSNSYDEDVAYVQKGDEVI